MPRRRALAGAQLADLLALPATEADLIRHWTLDMADLDAIERRRGDHIPRSCASLSRRCQTPRRLQRLKVWAARHQGPSSAGMARHAAPFRWRQMMASRVRRRSRCPVLPRGRTASIRGESRSHRPSAGTRARPSLAISAMWKYPPSGEAQGREACP